MIDQEEREGIIEDLSAEIRGRKREIESLNEKLVEARTKHEEILKTIYSLETDRNTEEKLLLEAEKQWTELSLTQKKK